MIVLQQEFGGRTTVHHRVEVRSWTESRCRLQTFTPFADCTGKWTIGANAMRAILTLSLLVIFCASAEAAKVRNSRLRNDIPVRVQGLSPDLSAQERQRLHDINIPSYDDPSKFGGG
jgi:hypothetical protein